MHTPANMPQILLMELVRRLIASQQGAVLPRTIGPAPVPPRPLVFPNDRGPHPVSRPSVVALPNPGHDRSAGRRSADILNARRTNSPSGATVSERALRRPSIL